MGSPVWTLHTQPILALLEALGKICIYGYKLLEELDEGPASKTAQRNLQEQQMFDLSMQDLDEKSNPSQGALHPQGGQDGSFVSLFSWSISRQLEAPRPRSEQPRPLCRCSGSWQSPHGGTATQRPALPPPLPAGTGGDHSPGRYKPGSRAAVGQLHPVCGSQREGTLVPPATKAPAFSRAWLCPARATSSSCCR